MTTVRQLLSVPLEEATCEQMLRAMWSQLDGIEETMADLATAVADLQRAVTDLAGRIGPTVDDLRARLAAAESAVVEERRRYDDLVAAEDLEDLAQDADLRAARDATDAALADASSAAEKVQAETAKLDAIAPAAEPPA